MSVARATTALKLRRAFRPLSTDSASAGALLQRIRAGFSEPRKLTPQLAEARAFWAERSSTYTDRAEFDSNVWNQRQIWQAALQVRTELSPAELQRVSGSVRKYSLQCVVA